MALQHCTVLIGLEPIIDGPLEICPVSVAEVFPHLIPVSCIAKRTTMSRLSVSIDISPANMDRSRLSPCCTKADGVRINGSRIKAVGTENCHIDIVGTVGIYPISITAWPDIDGNKHFSLELNRTDIAYADT